MTIRLLVLLVFLSTGTAHAFSLSDCVFNGMKGVSSDVAARQIRWACEQKLQEYKRARLKEFGEALDQDTFKQAPNWEDEGSGFHAMRFSNENSDKTITYARLLVAPAEDAGKPCDFSKRKSHAYKVSVKPGASIKLIYPSSATKSECVVTQFVFGRAPSWTDVSLFSSAKPMDNDPLAEFDLQ